MSEQRPVPNLMKALRESLEKAVQPPATPQEPERAVKHFVWNYCAKCGAQGTNDAALGGSTRCWHCCACGHVDCAYDAPDRSASTPSPGGQTWRPIETADRSSSAINRRIWGVVNGETRLIAYGFSSHTKWLTWCLADQGVEDFDACTPTHWQPYVVPSPPTPGGK